MNTIRMSRAWLLALVVLSTACGTSYFDLPTAPTATPPDPAIFTSQLVRGGSASHQFMRSTAGNIQVTLTDLNPAVVVGLGVGIPRPDGNGCNLTRSVDTTAGSSPQITITADAGTYCVKIYDIGQIAERATFSIRIAP